MVSTKVAADAVSYPPRSAPSPLLGPLGLIVTLGAALVVVLDFSIVNVALPSLSAEMGVSTMTAEWVVTAYALTFGGLLVVGGRASDLFGPPRLLVAGLVVSRSRRPPAVSRRTSRCSSQPVRYRAWPPRWSRPPPFRSSRRASPKVRPASASSATTA
jgi:hypothetical protein